MFSKILTVLGILLVAALLTVRSLPVGDANDKTSTTITPTDSTTPSTKTSTSVPGQWNPQKSGSEVLKSVTDKVRRDISPSTTPFPSLSYLQKSDSEEFDSTPGKVRRIAPSPSSSSPPAPPTPSPSDTNAQKTGSDAVKPTSDKTKRDVTSSTTTSSSPSTTTSSTPLKSGSEVLTPVKTGCINKRQAPNPTTASPQQSSPQLSGFSVLKPVPARSRRDTQTTTPVPTQNQSNPLKSGSDVLTPVTSAPPRTRRDTTSTTSAKPPASAASQKFGADKPKVTREVTTAKPSKQL